MSLHYYPHEDMHAKPVGPPEGWEPHATDFWPIAIINLTLVMAGVSFAADGGLIGAFVILGLIAGFNFLALGGRR